MHCPSCGAEVPQGARFCPGCAGPVAADPAADAPTELAVDAAPTPATAAPASGPAAPAGDGGRFLPGAVLAGRYRIVAVLGRGGMGEVYRADDLKLGQQVALKFLPESVAGDEEWLDRFLNEVKIARQISNPNVCRVYDVAEVDGHHFLSMEYIDGEDLASLLRRIGRLPQDKAVQIARQICAGLAAAHDQGVLHRDLKPANVMIDGRGNARLTDFGLAGVAEELGREDAASGTPAYMAPEQLAGREVTAKSDLYALGLVLYQLFTGKRAYRADSVAELSRLQESAPTSPSTLVEGLDPTIERVILRCLEKEPRGRPASALQVAAALPGGDPLAAALAAGETPSPEMVAAAGEEGSLAPGPAIALLACFTLLTLLFVAFVDRVQLPSQVPHELPRDVLAHRAKEMLAAFGAGPEGVVDRAQGFSHDRDVLLWLESAGREADGPKTGNPEADDAAPVDRWPLIRTGRPAILRYWYRQSPRELLPFGNQPKVVSWSEPSIDTSGMASIRLDTSGRLLDYIRVPPQLPPARDAEPPEPDWDGLFAAAGLEPERFRPAEPAWLPPVYADRRAAWTGAVPELPGVELRVETAAFQGAPVYFRLIGPWSRAERQVEFRASAPARFKNILGLGLILLVLATAGWIARRNLRAGRGDRRGAARVAMFVIVGQVLLWLFGGHHVRSVGLEFALFILSFGFILFNAAIVWVLYIALEPYVRRHHPHWLVSWSRLLAGRFRDPLIARDTLVGAAVGGVLSAIGVVFPLVERAVGGGDRLPEETDLEPLEGLLPALARLCSDLPGAVFGGMLMLFLWFLCRLLLRSNWLTGAVLVVILSLTLFGQGELSWIGIIFSVVPSVLFLLALVRFGLLTLITSLAFSIGISNLPISLDSSAWWSQASWINLALLAALAVWAFRGALGSRRPAAG